MPNQLKNNLPEQIGTPELAENYYRETIAVARPFSFFKAWEAVSKAPTSGIETLNEDHAPLYDGQRLFPIGVRFMEVPLNIVCT